MIFYLHLYQTTKTEEQEISFTTEPMELNTIKHNGSHPCPDVAFQQVMFLPPIASCSMSQQKSEGRNCDDIELSLGLLLTANQET